MAFETGCSQAIEIEGPRAMDKGSSLLLGIDGLVVDRVVIDDPAVGWCTARPTRRWLGGARAAGSSRRRRRNGW